MTTSTSSGLDFQREVSWRGPFGSKTVLLLAFMVLVLMAGADGVSGAWLEIADQDLDAAERAFDRDDLQEAEELLRSWIEQNRDDVSAHALLGDVLHARSVTAWDSPFGGASIAQAYRAEAQEEWIRAIELGETRPGPFLSLAISLRDDGDMVRAREYAERGREIEDLVDFRWLLADLHLRNGNYEEAANWADAVLETQSLVSPSTRFECALIGLEANGKRRRWEEADDLLQIAVDQERKLIARGEIETGEEGAFLCLRLWDLFGVHGNFEASARLYEKVTERLPESAWAFFYHGASLRRSGQYDRAIVPLHRALEIDSSIVAARHELGLSLFGTEAFRAAFEELSRAARSDPSRQTSAIDDLMILGRFVVGRFDFELAESCFSSVCELDPGRMDAHTNLALAQRQAGRYEASIKSYEEAREAFPEQNSIINDLALVYFGQGRIDDAITLFEQAAARDQIDAHENLAMIAWDDGDAKKSLAHLRKVLEIDPDRTKARFYFEKIKRVLQDKH